MCSGGWTAGGGGSETARGFFAFCFLRKKQEMMKIQMKVGTVGMESRGRSG